jgi:hypothetical protein
VPDGAQFSLAVEDHIRCFGRPVRHPFADGPFFRLTAAHRYRMMTTSTFDTSQDGLTLHAVELPDVGGTLHVLGPIGSAHLGQERSVLAWLPFSVARALGCF